MLWKSYTGGEKKTFKEKWAALGLNPAQLKWSILKYQSNRIRNAQTVVFYKWRASFLYLIEMLKNFKAKRL
jgi:hypothetical protein